MFGLQKSEETKVSTKWLGRDLIIKTGKLAQQTNAAVMVQYGETTILATVVEATENGRGDYFPLMVEFEERFYAAGMIKGSRWIKREGRPTDNAVLTGRMIDRTIRPLFDESSRKDLQVILTVLSVDHENSHDIVALIAASAALSVSGVKWNGPIGGLRVGYIDNKFVFNPTIEEMKSSDMDLIVAGTEKKTIMIEAGANEIPEDIFYKAITEGQAQMQEAIKLIREFQKKAGVKEIIKKEELISPEELEAKKTEEELIEIANNWLKENINKILFDKQYYSKKERKAAVVKMKNEIDKLLFDKGIEKNLRKTIIEKTVYSAVDTEITKELTLNERRVDGRKLDEIRKLSAEVDIFPRAHGTGLFQRGETQVLSVVTLGAPGLEQTLEDLEGETKKRYMHHYNFKPFCVGEARPIRSTGRREIGHGALAEKALAPVIPSQEEFPYTIRVVSETLGSNGSSSMGATCGSTLSLMAAGVPIKRPVAGVAIGLASNKDMSAWKVLTDIQDLEDGDGGMDFKITGTTQGITAIQLDTKTDGLNEEIIKEALERGLKGRLEILKVIEKAIPAPKKELSKHAPRIVSFKIDPEKIGIVIGPGGKMINKIIEETEVSIDIEDDGLVMICGADPKNTAIAQKQIEDLTHEFKAGEIFTGKVARILDFGAFVELLPGNDGMVHVSELAPYRIGNPNDFLSEGDIVTVKIKELDDRGRVSLTMKGLPENEALWKDKKGEQKGGGFDKPRFNNNRSNGNGRDRGPRRENNRGPRR